MHLEFLQLFKNQRPETSQNTFFHAEKFVYKSSYACWPEYPIILKHVGDEREIQIDIAFQIILGPAVLGLTSTRLFQDQMSKL